MSFQSNNNRNNASAKPQKGNRNNQRTPYEPDNFQKAFADLFTQQMNVFRNSILPALKEHSNGEAISRDELRDAEKNVFYIPCVDSGKYPISNPDWPDYKFFDLDRKVRINFETGEFMRATVSILVTSLTNVPCYYITAYLNNTWKGNVEVNVIDANGPSYRKFYRVNWAD